MTDLEQWVREHYGPADVEMLDLHRAYYHRQYDRAHRHTRPRRPKTIELYAEQEIALMRLARRAKCSQGAIVRLGLDRLLRTTKHQRIGWLIRQLNAQEVERSSERGATGEAPSAGLLAAPTIETRAS
jgi:hypothetical protein